MAAIRGSIGATVLAWSVGLPGIALGQAAAEKRVQGPAVAVDVPRELVPMPTMGGMQFWSDVLFFHDWRIQRNAVTGHCRLLDKNNLRHSWGTFEECLAALDQIKRERKLPPMRGKGVLVLHGIGDTRWRLSPLSHYLAKEGGYTAFNVSYASTRSGLGDHAESLASVIAHLDGIEQIDLVGFSLGSLVIRRYFGDPNDPLTPRRPDPRIRRLVMIGPPNDGSKLAADLGKHAIFREILGPSGQELGPQWQWAKQNLPAPSCEFGIVAGGTGGEKGYNPLLPGDDDGIVTVQSARLAGAADFVLVAKIHPQLPLDGHVHELVLRFLQRGYFTSADKRAPIPQACPAERR
jgi:pimeloyl-ACP methyl ester carboxylesterase